MTERLPDGPTPQQVFRMLSQELRQQADVALRIDAAVGQLDAPPDADLSDLQAVDRLRQTLEALAKLAANTADAIAPHANGALEADALCDDVHLEAVKALVDPQRHDAGPRDEVSLFL